MSLYKLCTGFDFLQQLLWFPMRARGNRRYHSTDEEVRIGAQLFIEFDRVCRPDEIRRAQVQHRLRPGFEFLWRPFSGNQQQAGDAERACTQQIAYQRDTVAIAAGQLDDRIDPAIKQYTGSCDRGQVQLAKLVVGQQDAIDMTFEDCSLLANGFRVRFRTQIDLRRYGKVISSGCFPEGFQLDVYTRQDMAYAKVMDWQIAHKDGLALAVYLW